MSGDWHKDDWHEEVLDDEGNYYRNDAVYEIPDVNRGSAEKRLDLTHGFVRHIVSTTVKALSLHCLPVAELLKLAC